MAQTSDITGTATVTVEEQIGRLRSTAHIADDFAKPHLWDVGQPFAPNSTIPGPLFAYLSHLKAFWEPQSSLDIPEEWTSTILPPNPRTRPPINLERWFPLSLLSALISLVSPLLNPISAASLATRYSSADYVGPMLPVTDPTGIVGSSVLRAMAKLLICEDDPFYLLALLLRGTYGGVFSQPDHRFPHHFGDDPSVIHFALVPERQPTTEIMVRRSQKAPLCFSSPALTIGIRLPDSDGEDECRPLTKQEVLGFARTTQPHLEALIARHQCHSEPTESLPLPCIFVIAFRDMTLFIVAHIAYLDATTYRYQSVVVDQIPFPLYVAGERERESIVARLRIIVALLTIRGHTDRLASLWDNVIWDPIIADAELAVLQDFTGIVTPNPSEHEDPDALIWGDMLDDIPLAFGGEDVTIDIGPSPSDIASSKELVSDWLSGDVDPEVPEFIISELW
ncbi:hypothetical protein C8R45DRAFT_1003181 [Mycena sanguinolenta]|nr:hypothetical protein C8R45DRAFT_1003181 [Mycena sanguinolenta]